MQEHTALDSFSLNLFRADIEFHFCAAVADQNVRGHRAGKVSDIKVPGGAGEIDDLEDIEKPEIFFGQYGIQHEKKDKPDKHRRKRDDPVASAVVIAFAACIEIQAGEAVFRL